MFEGDHGQPHGRTTDRPGGLSATTKQWISLKFTSLLKCELICLMIKDAHDDIFNLLIHIGPLHFICHSIAKSEGCMQCVARHRLGNVLLF